MVDGPNMYNFCGGDPVNRSDPMGTSFSDVLAKFIKDNGRKPTVTELTDLLNNASFKDLYLDPLTYEEHALRRSTGIVQARLFTRADIAGNSDDIASADEVFKGLNLTDDEKYTYYAAYKTRWAIVVALVNADPAYAAYTKALGKALLAVSPPALAASGAAQVMSAETPEDLEEGTMDMVAGATPMVLKGMSAPKTPKNFGNVTKEVAKERIPKQGDHNFVGPVPKGGWRLLQKGEGAHLVEKVNVRGRDALKAFDETGTPRYYPTGDKYAAGAAHKRLHDATSAEGINLQGGNPGMADAELLKAYRSAYSRPEIQGIRGTLKSPDGKVVLGEGLAPGEAFDLLMKWYAQNAEKADGILAP